MTRQQQLLAAVREPELGEQGNLQRHSSLCNQQDHISKQKQQKQTQKKKKQNRKFESV